MGVLMMTNSVVQIIADCNIKETKKTITHNNFSTCAPLFLDFLHLKIEFRIVVHHFCILCGYYVHIMQISVISNKI